MGNRGAKCNSVSRYRHDASALDKSGIEKVIADFKAAP
jgi:hypothetical protein